MSSQRSSLDNRQADGLCNDTTVEESVWSRGSTYVVYSFDRNPLDEAHSGAKTRGAGWPGERKPNLYRYENAGILVYDVRARIVGVGSSAPPLKVPNTPTFSEVDSKRLSSPTTRRELENALETDKISYIHMKTYTAFPTYPIEYTLEVPPNSLTFDSKFESGNLGKAVRIRESEYNLYLTYDTQTRGHTQWYYFSISNQVPGTFTFNIVNLVKFDSLYNEGQLPAVRSEKDGKDWHRDGFAVSYYENQRVVRSSETRRRTYTLTFMYMFKHSQDTVYFAHSVPYTFTELVKYLNGVKETKQEIARVSPMCKSIAGNVCELITITNNVTTYRSHEEELQEWAMSAAARRLNKQRVERQEKLAENLGKKLANEHRKKKGIVFTARAHPGETPGSFMLKGVLDFLLGDSREANLLRRNYVFKVVPMLNPDGVRYGNYRCSTLGVDLNRRWGSPSKLLHPTIFHTKKMVQAFGEWHQIVMFCDFHGHSCKRGVFAYGCSRRSFELEDRKKSVLARMIPILLSQKNPIFSFKDCHFRMEKSKEATARIVAFKELKIVNSYTIEASFYGPKSGNFFPSPRVDCHMLRSDYEQIGRDLCIVCLNLISKSVFSKKLRQVSDWLRGKRDPASLLDSPEKQQRSNVWFSQRSRSMQDSLIQKISTPSCDRAIRSDFVELGNTPMSQNRVIPQSTQPRPILRPISSPSPRGEADIDLSDLESIQEGDEEEEVLGEALQEDGLWTDLLNNEELMESNDEDGGGSDSAPSDHGEPLNTPKPIKKPLKKKRNLTKICKTEPQEEKTESEEKIVRRNSNQGLRINLPPPTRLPRPSKSPKNYTNSGSIVNFSFIEDSARGQCDISMRESGLRKPGRLAELLRGPEPREKSPLQVHGLSKLSDKARKVGINHYSFLALQRKLDGEKLESAYDAGSSSTRVTSAHPFRRKCPDPRSRPQEETYRRISKLRPYRLQEAPPTTIESVIQAKDLRKKPDFDPVGDSSLLGALPKFQFKEGQIEHFMMYHRPGKWKSGQKGL